MTIHDDNIEALVRALWNAKRKKDDIEKEYAAVEAELLGLIDENVKSLSTDTPEFEITANVVRGTRIVIDEDRLKKQLGAAMWKRVTTPTLDKAKLEASIALGDVDPTTVAMVSDEKANKPYFRFKEERKKVTRHRTPSAAAQAIKQRRK